MTLSQSLFPVGSWVVSEAGVATSLNKWSGNKNPVPSALEPTAGTRACAEALRDEINSITPRMDRMLDDRLVPHMVLTARRLAYLNSNFSATDDTPSMTPVLAVLAQHLLTIAEWNMTASSNPGATTTSFPVRWQVYASGPREAWEWAAVTVLVVVLLALLAGGLHGLATRIEPGPWLELAGIMLLANQSAPMVKVTGSVGGDASAEAKKAMYYVRGTGSNNPGLVLVDQKDAGEKIDRERSYQSDGCEIIQKREIDWLPWRRVFKATTAAWVQWRAAWSRWRKRKP